MRILIAFLLLVCGVAAIFYETSASLPWQHRIDSERSASRDPAGDAIDQGPGGTDEDTRLESEFATGDRNAPDQLAGIQPPAAATQSIEDEARRVEHGASPRSAPMPGMRQASEKIDDLQRSLDAALQRERNEARSATGNLAATQTHLDAALKERSTLLARATDLGAENAKLRSAAQKADELATERGRSVEQAKRDAAGSGLALSSVQSQIVALQSKADEAAAAKRELQERLARSDTLAAQLQTKLTVLATTTQETISHIRSDLATKSEVVDQQARTVAEVSEKLRGAEHDVRENADRRAAANHAMASAKAQQGLASTGLRVARLALASANARAASARRATDLSLQNDRGLANHNDALRKQAAEVRAKVEALKGTMARTVAANAMLRARMQASLSGQRVARAELARAQTEKTSLTARAKFATDESDKQLAIARQRNAVLASDAARLPDLARKIGTLESLVQEGRKQGRVSQAMVASLELEKIGHLARIDTLAKKLEAGDQARVAQAPTASGNKGLDGAQAEKLLAALASARAELAQAGRDEASAEHARQLSAKGLADHDATMQVERDQTAHRTTEMAERLGAERDRAKTLATDLGAAQAQLAQAVRDRTSADVTRRAAEQATADSAAQLRNARNQVALLSAQTAKAASGAVQMTAVAKDLAAEHEKTRRLETALTMEQARVGSATLALRSAEKAHAEADAKLRAELTQARAVAATARAGQAKPAAVAARRSSPGVIREAMRTPTTGGEGAQAGPAKAPTRERDAGAAIPMPMPEARSSRATPHDADLPDAMPAHVLLRYAHDKAQVQVRAHALEATLRSLGLEVRDAVAANAGQPGDSVTYFYKEDRTIADRVAKQLEAPAPVQSRGPGARAARPGTIEVVVGG